MGLQLLDLQPIKDTYYSVIPGVSTTPLRWIDLVVVCSSKNNKRRETLTFEVANFDMGYNCMMGRTFLVKFMVLTDTTYAIIKLPRPKGVITIESSIKDILKCDINALTKAKHFGAEAATTKAAKTQGSSFPRIVVGTKLPNGLKMTAASTLPPTEESTPKMLVPSGGHKEVLIDAGDRSKAVTVRSHVFKLL
jgi:hypothetical protein